MPSVCARGQHWQSHDHTINCNFCFLLQKDIKTMTVVWRIMSTTPRKNSWLHWYLREKQKLIITATMYWVLSMCQTLIKHSRALSFILTAFLWERCHYHHPHEGQSLWGTGRISKLPKFNQLLNSRVRIQMCFQAVGLEFVLLITAMFSPHKLTGQVGDMGKRMTPKQREQQAEQAWRVWATRGWRSGQGQF